ncbi:MFS transporter [Salinicoccus jeotgali]|uniref:MFS transporter n=1 Tax=Salinicoccus jeotgali TaxID=381634 RepID=A0ABP7F3U2_9STAP
MDKVKIGIKENLMQFTFLVVMSFFVGSMVGIERTVLPLLGEEEFGLISTSAALSFIITFGFSKAVINYFAGGIADRYGRRRVLIVGWIIGLFVPILIITAGSWWIIVLANMMLGINQGLTWSMTVNMKIDLARSDQRGTAVGLNEFAGYTGVAVLAAVSASISSNYGMRPEPFYIGIGIALVGLLLSITIKDTEQHLELEERNSGTESNHLTAKQIFKRTTLQDRNLSSASLAGLSTNLKDGMAWGLFPIYFVAAGLTVPQVGMIVAIYPAAWGVFQLFTGTLSDRLGRKPFIVSGMLVQAAALWFIIFTQGYGLWITGAIILGLGTAMVYPTLQAAISDVAAPAWRASSMGVYRFWRDSGYAFGALFAGIAADLLGVGAAIGIVAILPLLSGIAAYIRMDETLK